MIQSSNAAKKPARHLGRPCKSFSIQVGCMVVDPSNDNELFAILNMNEISNMELILINAEKNEGKAFQASHGDGSWGMLEVPNDLLIIGTYYHGEFAVFDLVKKEFISYPKFPGAEDERYIRNLVLGKHDCVYGGSYPKGRLAKLDLIDYNVEDCGNPSESSRYDMPRVSATPDGCILCYCTGDRPSVWLYDPDNPDNRFKSLESTLWNWTIDDVNNGAACAGSGVVWNGYFLPRMINTGVIVLEGPSLTEISVPFQLPQKILVEGGYYVDLNLTTNDLLFIHQELKDNNGTTFHSLYRYAKDDKNPMVITENMDLHGGKLLTSNKKGEVLGVRGGDYFVIRPGDETLNLIPIPVETCPRSIAFLRADPKGRLWGGPRFGQTLFGMNPVKYKLIAPVKCKSINTKVVCDADGEVYDVAFFNDKIYAVAYAGGDIIQYDPMQPWDQLNRRNPRTIASVGPSPVEPNTADRHPTSSYTRPTGGIVLGPDFKLYSGWQKKSGCYGGAIAITDPDTGQTEIIENPLGEQTVNGLAVDENYMYVGTSLVANGMNPKLCETPRFGYINKMDTRDVTICDDEFLSSYCVGPIALDAVTKRLLIFSKLILSLNPLKIENCPPRIFDTLSMKFEKIRSFTVPNIDSFTIAASGNGKAYYGSGRQIICIDMRDLDISIIGALPENAGNVYALAVSEKGYVYASSGADVYRIDG